MNEFKRVRTPTKDEHRSGRPVEVTPPEMIDRIHDMVLCERRIKVREIVEFAGISQGAVFLILHEKLAVKRIPAKWLQNGRTRRSSPKQMPILRTVRNPTFWMDYKSWRNA